MKKNEKNNVKSDVITGASSAVGATIGMMAGNALATEVSATDEVPQPEKPSKPTAASPAQPATNAEQQAGNTAGNQPSAVANNEVNNVTINQTNIGDNNNNNLQVQPEPQPVENVEVVVLGYETVTNDDGSQMDVAMLSLDGQQVIVADVDMDGKADILASDSNCNGSLDNEEFVDISGEGIEMAAFRAPVSHDENLYLADNDDYINDANVDDFMA